MTIMGLLSWIRDLFDVPTGPALAYEHRDGWVFHQGEVSRAILLQSRSESRSDVYGNFLVPAKGCGWWADVATGRTFRERDIFDTRLEALDHARKESRKDLDRVRVRMGQLNMEYRELLREQCAEGEEQEDGQNQDTPP